MRVSEIRVNQIRVNQGLGVYQLIDFQQLLSDISYLWTHYLVDLVLHFETWSVIHKIAMMLANFAML